MTRLPITNSSGKPDLSDFLPSRAWEKKKELIEKAGASKHKNDFIHGSGSNSLLENLELIKHGLNNGMKKYLLMPPAYFSKIYNDDGVYKYFASLIEKLPEQIFIC